MKKAAAYVRMSTHKQEDSPKRQRDEIELYAAQNGYEILEWYEDHGITGTSSAKRKGFQKLMNDAKAGRWQFVLMYEQSRFSRANPLEFLTQLWQLLECGVKLVTTMKGVVETGDIGGLLQTVITSHTARQESETIGHRSTSGRRRKVFEEGQRMGGALFAFDRIITDRDGKFQTRIHFRTRYAKSKDQLATLAPSSEIEAVEAVRWAFDATLAGTPSNSIAAEFNKRQVRTVFGKHWRQKNVRNMLTNPAYCGRQRIGFFANGKFARVTDEVLIVNEAHAGIVSTKVFDAVQEILQRRKATICVNRRPLHFPLTGMVFCGRCGSYLCGNFKYDIGRGYYRCQDYRNHPRQQYCGAVFSATILHAAVLKAVKAHILSDENILAAYAARGNLESSPSPAVARIEELTAKMNLATERLACERLNDDELDAISAKRRELQRELNQLRRQIAPARSIETSVFSLEQLQICVDEAQIEYDPQMRDVMLALLDSVTVWTGRRAGERRVRVTFNPEIYFGDPIMLTEEDLFPDSQWREAAKIVHSAPGPIRLRDVSKAMGVSGPGAIAALKRAVGNGCVRRISRGMYVPARNPVGLVDEPETSRN